MAEYSRLLKISRILHRRISLCAVVAVMLACFVSAVAACAQEERPQILPGERKAVARKKDAGPRAVAVLRMDAKGKVSLVPIAIMISGKFWDASAYKADPVPMALEPGTVYEGERAGSSLGLFTIGSALHSNSVNVPTPWIATGVWRAEGSEPEKKVMKAETKPANMETGDKPPRLTHTPTNTTEASPAQGSGKAPSSATPSSSAPSSAPSASEKPSDSSDSGDGPPRLSKPSSQESDSTGSKQPGSSAPAPNSSGTPTGGTPKLGDKKADEKKADDQANVPASDSGAKEVNRPILRRGKPVESFADEDVPGYSKPGGRPAATASKSTDNVPGMDDAQIVPAISDASGPEPRSYAFEWVKGDEDDRHKQMLELAKAEVRAYIAARIKATTVPSPARTATARRAVKTPDPVLENVKMTAYDLWNSNQPIIVFSATAHMPPPAAGSAHAQTVSDLEYAIMLVTYPDIYNNLHKVYSGVTDKFHLDVTPRMEFIDAVDADGDGRGELLFRETSDLGTGWGIYRATADKLWKLYDSLNPQ